MTLGFIGTLTAYIIVAVLLLSFNIGPRWAWWVKGTGIVVTSAFFVISYYSIIGLMGWPVEARLPERFQLHWARINEPDKLLNTPGAIYLWAEELDDANIPVGIPRAYKLPYTEPLDNGVTDAMDMISMGQEVGGTAQDYDEDEDAGEDAEGMDPELARELENLGQGGYTDPDELRIEDMVLTFRELEEVRLPGKEFGPG
jgi:hypothetical protein